MNRTALHYAIKSKSLDLFYLLISKGANINPQDSPSQKMIK